MEYGSLGDFLGTDVPSVSVRTRTHVPSSTGAKITILSERHSLDLSSKPVIPSYRHIRSRIQSFRPTKPKNGDLDPAQLRDLDHRNELMLAGHHHMLRTIKQEQKRTVQAHPFPTVTDFFQRRLNHRLRKLTHPEDQTALWKASEKDMFTKASLRTSREAVLAANAIPCAKWRKTHGKTYKGDSGIIETAKTLYETADWEDGGRVQRGKLVWMLLALGVRMDAEDVETALAKYCRAANTVQMQQWVDFLDDHSPMLTVIQRKLPAEVSFQQSDTPQSDIESFIMDTEVQFQRLSVVWEDILSAWKHLDPLNTRKASVPRAADILVNLGVAMQVRTALKLLSPHTSTISKPAFLALFLRPMLRLHIEAIAKAMRRHWKGEMTVGQKVAEVTRVNIMSGLMFSRKKSRYGSLAVGRLQQMESGLSVGYAEYKEHMERLIKTPSPDISFQHTRSYDTRTSLPSSLHKLSLSSGFSDSHSQLQQFLDQPRLPGLSLFL